MDIATTLLEYGAQADAESKAGFTPLHLSAQEGHSDMSSLLLEHQADPNHAAKVSENTPIKRKYISASVFLLKCVLNAA
jgi:ankyrin repeat protein